MIKKGLLTFLMLLLVVTVSGCFSNDTGGDGSVEAKADTGKYEVALVVDPVGSIDDKSFNQGSWEAIERYAKDNNKTYKHYKATDRSSSSLYEAIELAIQAGAKVVVTPGYTFEEAVYQAQIEYPDISIILVDGTPHDGEYNFEIGERTLSILYAEEQAGFLAGYAAVKEGYRDLGFMGGVSVPSVVRFGYGFAQGADYAGYELGLKPGDIRLKYKYTGSFLPSPDIQSEAASWYQSGTEVIFACGGGIGSSIMASAEATGKHVIGVDVDQSFESESVITSAIKQIDASVYNSIDDYYKGNFAGGEAITYDATMDGLGLPMDVSKFSNFGKDDYNKIYTKLADNIDGLADSILNDTQANSVTDIITKVLSVEP